MLTGYTVGDTCVTIYWLKLIGKDLGHRGEEQVLEIFDPGGSPPMYDGTSGYKENSLVRERWEVGESRMEYQCFR